MMIDGQRETIDFLFNRQGKSMEKGVVELLVLHGVNGWAFPYFSDLFLVEGVGKLWGSLERKLHVPIRKHANVSLHVAIKGNLVGGSHKVACAEPKLGIVCRWPFRIAKLENPFQLGQRCGWCFGSGESETK
jgi:hypothetical protein